MLRIGGQVIALATRPRRRLGLIGAEIANGPQGRLFGPEAVLRVETGLSVTETRRLRLSIAGVVRVIDVAVTEGIGECRLADGTLVRLFGTPGQLRFDFMFPGFLVWASPHGLIANMAQPGRTVNEMVFTWHLLVPKAMLGHEAIEAFREEQAGFMDLIQSEDQSCLAPIHRTFQVIGPEEWTSGPYAKAEGAVLDFHQWYLTRLGAGC
jgi:hypothetical protein